MSWICLVGVFFLRSLPSDSSPLFTTIWENMFGSFFHSHRGLLQIQDVGWIFESKVFFFGIRIGEFWFLYETKAKKIHVGEYHPILVPEVFTKRDTLYLQLYNHLKWKKYLGRFFPLRLGSMGTTLLRLQPWCNRLKPSGNWCFLLSFAASTEHLTTSPSAMVTSKISINNILVVD